MEKILVEPKNALIKQYIAMLATEDVHVHFKPEAILEIATFATQVNEKTENIGARRLHTMMEKLMEEISFEASDLAGKTIEIDIKYVQDKLKNMVENEDLARYVL